MFLDCLPQISWWIELLEQEQAIIKINHSFQKQSALSQYKIAGPNGEIQLSIPTKKASRKGPLEKVEISYEEDWVLDHLKSMDAAYSSAPFYIYYDYKLKKIFLNRPRYLMQLNKAFFEFGLSQLKLDIIPIINSTEACNYSALEARDIKVYPQVFDDRNSFNPSLSFIDLLFNLGPETKSYLNDYSAVS